MAAASVKASIFGRPCRWTRRLTCLSTWQKHLPRVSGTSTSICPDTLRNLISNLHQGPPKPHQQPGTPRNLISHLHRSSPPHHLSARNPPEPHQIHQQSAPELSGTSSAIAAICPGTLRNIISHLPRTPAEPHQPSAPEPSAASPICPEPSGTADSRQGSGGFRCRWLMKSWRVPGQKADEVRFRKVPGADG